MILVNLTSKQCDIVKDICNKQIQSLLRISSEQSVQKELIEIGICDKNLEIDVHISNMLRSFDRLKYNPGILLTLENDCLRLFKHNLFTNDNRYSSNGYKPHKSGLWVKLDMVDNFKVNQLIPN